MDVEVVLQRKIIQLMKTWLPVLLLMGLLIAVDFLDSAEGESFLSKVKSLSSGFGTQEYHLELQPAHTVLSSYENANDNHGRHEQFWKARHLLQRPTPLGCKSHSCNPTITVGLVPPKPQLG